MNDDLQANYAKAFSHRLELGARPALILVDFVQAYFEPACPLYADVDDVLERALGLRDRARAQGVPVIYTRVEYREDAADGGVFVRKVPVLRNFIAGNPLGAWPAGLEPEAGELVITKQYASAFFGTSLASTLHAQGIDTLVITGLTTSGCVRATCVDAISHGFIPVVVSDACGDRHPAPHEANLFDMAAKYAEVLDSDEAGRYFGRLRVSSSGTAP